MISWSKRRPSNRSCAEVGSVISGVTAVRPSFQICTRTGWRTKTSGLKKDLLKNTRIVDKGPVQIWLTSVVSLLAAVAGGWIAGRYAVHAQKHAAKEQRQSDREAERRAVNGTLQAIRPELEVFNTELVGELKKIRGLG
jgi:hypothetical protein